MKVLILGAALALLLTATALAAPKPWQWTPAKAAKRLVAAQPFELDSGLDSASCVSRGRGVAGRFSAFRCRVEFNSYEAVVLIRILPRGTGKLCVLTNAEGKALPHIAGTQGLNVVPARACP